MKVLLEVKNLKVSFKQEGNLFRAVNDVNFCVEKGKILGIVGESGCGKSVTAMSVLNLLPKNAVIEDGEIFFYGENILKLKDSEKRLFRGSKIALIPQDPLSSLNPLLTIGEQLVETIIEHKKVSRKEAEKLAIKALIDVKIPSPEKRIKDYPHQFSGGMSQRVLIAMAFCCNPSLIIADEPTTALDVTVQAQILDLMKQIQRENNTSFIFITHDLALVSEFCDFTAVMYSGEIIEYSETFDIFNNPLHPYTQALLDSVPCGEKEELKTIKGYPPSINDKISGCRFHPRCKFKKDICEFKKPLFIENRKNHGVSCFLYSILLSG